MNGNGNIFTIYISGNIDIEEYFLSGIKEKFITSVYFNVNTCDICLFEIFSLTKQLRGIQMMIDNFSRWSVFYYFAMIKQDAAMAQISYGTQIV